ncbi:hypothetical protein EWM64_g8928 [Hericium alpestre]|uniref:Alcohol dehydrogenase-like N-terminal domain-containing protein n=1 Tax=Hericium alpestre TaxID=135208 RepID=A0A4Y9ZLB1_9AGAM|nr:hypothetical protein EWM64_g8928 [Hericium alpestre]
MSSEIPTTQRAAIVQPDKTVAVQTVPVTPPGPGEVLIKVAVAAQNPSDWKTIHWGMVKPGQGVGSDFAGRVVALGDGVHDVKLGERVAGWQVPAEGDLNASTAYREYTTITSAPLIHIPNNVSDEEIFVSPGGQRVLTCYSNKYNPNARLRENQAASLSC